MSMQSRGYFRPTPHCLSNPRPQSIRGETDLRLAALFGSLLLLPFAPSSPSLSQRCKNFSLLKKSFHRRSLGIIHHPIPTLVSLASSFIMPVSPIAAHRGRRSRRTRRHKRSVSFPPSDRSLRRRQLGDRAPAVVEDCFDLFQNRGPHVDPHGHVGTAVGVSGSPLLPATTRCGHC